MGRAFFAESMAQEARKPLWASIAISLLDVGMMIVAIMAYTGAQSSEDSAVIRDTFVTFPDAGDHIQRLEIALPALSLVVTIALAVLLTMRMRRLGAEFNRANLVSAQRVVTFFYLPWYSVNLLVWAVCVGFQSSYVPLLDVNILPECEIYGSRLMQCGMVSGTWILAMVFCMVDIMMIVLGLNIFFHLHHPALNEGRQPKFYHPTAHGRQHSAALSSRSSRPPSYGKIDSPPSYGYYGPSIPLSNRDRPPRTEMLREDA